MHLRTRLRFTASAAAASTAMFLFAVCGAILPGSASASTTSVQLIVSGKPAPFVVPPYLDQNGVIMAPVDFVRLLGADYSVSTGSNVVITSASGKTFTEAFQHVNDRLMVPVESTAASLGASATWSPSTNTISLRSRLEVARVDSDGVVIATSYPVYYKTQTLDNPARLVIDLYGTDLDSPPAAIPSDNDSVTRIRSGQLDEQTVRVVLDLTKPIKYKVNCGVQTSAIKLALGTQSTDTAPIPIIGNAPEPQAVQEAQKPTVLPTPAPAIPQGMVPLPSLGNNGATASNSSSEPTKIINVQYKSVNSEVSQVIITTAGPINVADDSYKSMLLNNPNRLAFSVSNSQIAVSDSSGGALNSLVPDANELLKDVRWGIESTVLAAAGQIVIDLIHPVVYTVTTNNLDDNSGVQYIINIQESAFNVPSGMASNSIAGKIVIVDAGHGGKDSGAVGRNGIFEKNFTLAIAKQLRDALVAAGATPIMSRSDDTFIPLDQRSELGIQSHADYFISIHCDSSGHQNSLSGDTVYYHGSVGTCRQLAKSIANRLSQLGIAIQSNGVKSDYIRFPGIGFSVLRKSPETAVLVECGYVNDDNDAKALGQTDVQQQLASGIVAGLRDYVASQ